MPRSTDKWGRITELYLAPARFYSIAIDFAVGANIQSLPGWQPYYCFLYNATGNNIVITYNDQEFTIIPNATAFVDRTTGVISGSGLVVMSDRPLGINPISSIPTQLPTAILFNSFPVSTVWGTAAQPVAGTNIGGSPSASATWKGAVAPTTGTWVFVPATTYGPGPWYLTIIDPLGNVIQGPTIAGGTPSNGGLFTQSPMVIPVQAGYAYILSDDYLGTYVITTAEGYINPT